MRLASLAALFLSLVACADGEPPADPGSLCACREVDGVEECCFGNGVCVDQPEGPRRCECDLGARGKTCATPTPGVHALPARDCAGDDPSCARAYDHVVVSSFDTCVDLEGAAFESTVVRPALDETGAWPKRAPFPVAVFVHGASQAPSDYYDLLSHVAANGIVMAAIDVSLAGEYTFRANRLLSYLECFRASFPDRALLGDRYALVGHSRGGAAVAVAAEAIAAGVAAEGVAVDAIVALAPSSDVIELAPEATPAYFTMQGARDPDTRGASLAWYDHASAGSPTMVRSLAWIFGATHQRFHQGLLAAGTGELESSFGAEAHWTLARAYIGGFLSWRMQGVDAYRPYFTGEAIPAAVADIWEEEAQVFSSFADGTLDRRVLHDFESGVLSPSSVDGAVTPSGVMDATVAPPEELDAPWSSSLGSAAARLRWDGSGAASLAFDIPAAVADASAFNVLSVRLGRPFGPASGGDCDETRADVDLSIVLADGAGTEHARSITSLGAGGRVVLPDHFDPETIGNWYDGDCHAVDHLRTVRLPLASFCEAGVDLTALSTVEIRGAAGTADEVIVDDVVLERGEGELAAACP